MPKLTDEQVHAQQEAARASFLDKVDRVHQKFDHQYEHGDYFVCRRCGLDKKDHK